MSLVYYQEGERFEPRLSFFVLPEDDDGIEDLDELQLFHDRDGVYWTLKSDDWKTYEAGSQHWIGSYALALPEGEQPPSGQYRAVLIDKSGEKSERKFGFDFPTTQLHPSPAFSIDLGRGTYKVVSSYPANYLLCYDGEGNYVGRLLLKEPEGPVSALGLQANVRSVAFWAEDRPYYISALSEVLPVR
jgi:hypothetical protein